MDRIAKLKQLWHKRNPQHELHGDSGEDMFWNTVLCIFDDLQKLTISNVEQNNYLPHKYCSQCGEPIARKHKFWCSSSNHHIE